ncbi:GNAT family N-acetyltransferase [uncultured Tateyamaria sp.]|uniref:GNAT family N-acetyltransferase n=1 Tax=uncultured Tateyamaria sp. TaxID=455651 RepID=UPI0026230BC2|nr:GNAT family N-acetyltransferase [uncultured Tateyamaria sp.]
MTVTIRPPKSCDKSAWQDLWRQYNAFYGRDGDTALSEAVINCTWARLLDPDEPVIGCFAEQDHDVVGLAHIVFHRNLIQIADTCYLQDLFTVPEARGGGVAQALIHAVGDLCQARGVSDIYWHTHRDNSAARTLYDRLATNTEFIVYRTHA